MFFYDYFQSIGVSEDFSKYFNMLFCYLYYSRHYIYCSRSHYLESLITFFENFLKKQKTNFDDLLINHRAPLHCFTSFLYSSSSTIKLFPVVLKIFRSLKYTCLIVLVAVTIISPYGLYAF
jgi:miniconductance mechanosensitive channel